jgi:hypothetical protein
MHTNATARHRTPYGLSFQVQELVFVRQWAERQGLTLAVKLDQVIDGAEFEELLMISASGRARQALTLWRTDHSYIAQAAGGHPKGFACIQQALAHFAGIFGSVPSPARAASRWKRLLARF